MRRATRDEDKAARRASLCASGWELFQARPFEAINVQDVATQAGLAKGTFYLYFTTKEELFLSIQAEQFAAWFDRLDASLGALPPHSTPEAVASAIVATLAGEPALLRLLSITHAILERNAGPEPIARLKHQLHERLHITGTILERQFPQLRPGEGPLLLLRAYALVVGLFSMAEPSPAARAAIDSDPSLALFAIDFPAELSAALAALLHGAALAASATGR